MEVRAINYIVACARNGDPDDLVIIGGTPSRAEGEFLARMASVVAFDEGIAGVGEAMVLPVSLFQGARAVLDGAAALPIAVEDEDTSGFENLGA